MKKKPKKEFSKLKFGFFHMDGPIKLSQKSWIELVMEESVFIFV
mgnify:CR=1 FL=1